MLAKEELNELIAKRGILKGLGNSDNKCDTHG